MKKIVQIEFADPKVDAVQHIDDIRRAVKRAIPNLMIKYDVELSLPFVKDSMLLIYLDIPEPLCKSFSLGPHLKGIAEYLLKNFDRYKDYLVGTRLLYFKEDLTCANIVKKEFH